MLPHGDLSSWSETCRFYPSYSNRLLASSWQSTWHWLVFILSSVSLLEVPFNRDHAPKGGHRSHWGDQYRTSRTDWSSRSLGCVWYGQPQYAYWSTCLELMGPLSCTRLVLTGFALISVVTDRWCSSTGSRHPSAPSCAASLKAPYLGLCCFCSTLPTWVS